MFWIILFGLVAIVIGIIATGTTVRTGIREPGEPRLRFTIIWPNGDVFRWPR